MIELKSGIPDHVVAARITGDISGQEFDTLFKPAVDAVLAKYARANIILELPEGVPGRKAGKDLWSSGKLSMADLRQFDKLALVSDLDWVRKVTGMFGLFAPCTMKRFAADAFDDALQWVTR